jgi:hypothetical protein
MYDMSIMMSSSIGFSLSQITSFQGWMFGYFISGLDVRDLRRKVHDASSRDDVQSTLETGSFKTFTCSI